MLPESRNSALSTGSKTVRSSFPNISCSGRQVGELFLLFGKSESCMKTYVDFKLEKNLSSKLLNMDKTYDFVIKPLKMTPLVHIPNFGGLSGSEDRGGGDNSIQFINVGRVGDKRFKVW